MNYASYKVTKVWEDDSISAIIILNGIEMTTVNKLSITSVNNFIDILNTAYLIGYNKGVKQTVLDVKRSGVLPIGTDVFIEDKKE